MTQAIRSIKTGQLFEVVEMSCHGFEIGCIIEALDDTTNVEEYAGNFKWIGGFKPSSYGYKDIVLRQNVQDLKRYKGKIK